MDRDTKNITTKPVSAEVKEGGRNKPKTLPSDIQVATEPQSPSSLPPQASPVITQVRSLCY